MNTNTQSCKKTIRPASSVIHRQDGVIIECDMPGVARDGINLTVDNDVLTIKGRRTKTQPGSLLHRESSALDFARSFSLDGGFDAGRIQARAESGVLRVFLPKAEAAKPRQIPVA
jgi:HSP20 family protein